MIVKKHIRNRTLYHQIKELSHSYNQFLEYLRNQKLSTLKN